MQVHEVSQKVNHDLVLRFLWDLIRVSEFWGAGRRGRGKFLNSSPVSIQKVLAIGAAHFASDRALKLSKMQCSQGEDPDA